MKTRSILQWIVVASVLAAAVGYSLAMATVGLGFAQGLKQTAKMIDSRLLGGRLLALLKHEHIPATVPPPPAAAYDWLGNQALLSIAHGLGPQLWGGINSRATFEEGYIRGFRIFEVDLAITSDGRLVFFHGADERQLDRTSWQQYVDRLRIEGLDPLEFAQLVEWARRNSELRFVLDVKNRFDDAYRLARAAIGSPALGQSFIPQIYHFDQLEQFRADHFFAGEIFTSYQSGLSTTAILQAAERLQVRVVTLTRERVDQLRQVPASVVILTHPVDDAFDAARLRARGIRGIYTSYVSPASAPEVFAPWPNGCQPGSQWKECHFMTATSPEKTPSR
jgi:glycerophosphoryl diester phosphodiesterase